MAGAIIIQTLCGRLLSLESHTHRPDEQLDEDPTWAIALLLAGSLVQVGVVARWWSVIRATARSKATSVPTEEELGLLDDGRVPSPLSSSSSESEAAARGYRCLYAATGIVVLSWVCFLSNLV